MSQHATCVPMPPGEPSLTAYTHTHPQHPPTHLALPEPSPEAMPAPPGSTITGYAGLPAPPGLVGTGMSWRNAKWPSTCCATICRQAGRQAGWKVGGQGGRWPGRACGWVKVAREQGEDPA